MKLSFLLLNFKRYFTLVFLVAINICNAQWVLQNSPINSDLYDVSFVDSLHGWIAGNNGLILHTSNGGNNWYPQTSTVSNSLQSISFCDTMHGWAVGSKGTVLTTSDGGEIWTFIELDTSINIYNTKVQCISPSTAVIFNIRFEYDVFVDPRVWITSNTGLTWTEIAPQPGYFSWWFDFHFVTDSIGLITGISGNAYEKLIVVRTNDGGLTLDTSYVDWKVQGGFKRIYFKNKYEGWLLADSIYHSINTGIDWKGITINDFNSSRDLIMFGDTGYVVQQYGNIFQTTDGGYTWNLQSLEINPVINKIDFINPNIGWAVGQNGTIAYTNNGGITGIDNYSTTSDWESFRLYQNYPNPFNPTTTIKYNLPQSSVVLIQIFNILGENIKTLYSGQQTSGIHEIVFDGSSLPSGIYLYQITTRDFRQIKKCLLLN